jgi:hypothetical protein
MGLSYLKHFTRLKGASVETFFNIQWQWAMASAQRTRRVSGRGTARHVLRR